MTAVSLELICIVCTGTITIDCNLDDVPGWLALSDVAMCQRCDGQAWLRSEGTPILEQVKAKWTECKT